MKVRVVYECDRTKCENCSDLCHHTFDISHAVNFTRTDVGEKVYYVETVRRKDVQQEHNRGQDEAPE